MTWREQMQPGSFAGVAFVGQNLNLRGGRRVVAHEYAGRDDHVAEDMGKKARNHRLRVFVAGDDYMVRRDALLDALEAGVGLLVHPTLGEIRAICDTFEMTESSKAGGSASFNITFIPAGSRGVPKSTSAGSSLVSGLGALAKTAVASSFSTKFAVSGLPSEVQSQAQTEIATQSSTLRDLTTGEGSEGIGDIGSLVEALDELDANVATWMATPATLGEKLQAIVALIDGIAALEIFTKPAGTAGPTTTHSTTTTQASDAARNAVMRMLYQTALVEAAELAAATEWTVVDDATAVRDWIVARVDAEMLLDVDVDAYDKVNDVVASLVQHINLITADLPALETEQLDTVGSALELAHTLYGDSTREAEIVARNRIAHPGFVTGAVQVLSS